MSLTMTETAAADPTRTDSAEGVSARIRQVIRASGRSQREFAAALGLDPTALSKSLRGTRRWRAEDGRWWGRRWCGMRR